MTQPVSILHVDERASDREEIRQALQRSEDPPELKEASSPQELEALLTGSAFDVVLTDLGVLGFSGLALPDVIRGLAPGVPIVIVTGPGSEDLAIEAVKRGAADYVIKTPARIGRLPHAVRAAVLCERLRRESSRSEQELRRLVKAFETLQIGVTITDNEGRILYTNPAEAAMHGYTVEELLGQSARIFAPGDRWSPISLDKLRGLHGWRRESANRHRDGTVFPVQLISDAVTDVAGLPTGIVTCCVNITDRKKAEQALRAAEERYRAIFDKNPVGVYRRTPEGRITECNESFARIFGFPSKESVLADESWTFHSSEEDARATAERLIRERSVPNDEIRLRRQDGGTVWALRSENLVEAVGESPAFVEGSLVDITGRKRAEEQIEFRAYHDLLTGLPNRALFNDRLTMALGQLQRTGRRLAVMYLDLDHFKTINDTLGHEVGDRLLRAVSDRLQGCVREHDTVARVGGDEFTILLPSLRRAEDSRVVAQKILSAIEKPFQVDNHELFSTTSVGIALYPADGDSAGELLKNADRALYRAKEAGRNNFQQGASVPGIRPRKAGAAEPDLRRALERDEMLLHYAPIVSLGDGENTGVEALLRWRHPRRGFLSLEEFAPLAEDLGLLLPLGEWTLREACRQMKGWQDSGVAPPRMSVKLTSRHFRQSALAAAVENLLEETSLDPQRLQLEIAETTAMQNVDLTLPLLQRLADQGIGICLDDFGTGYSSLKYLQLLPLQRLKIDRSLVTPIGRGERERAVVRAIIAMAHALGLRAVAQGVEEEDQTAILRDLGCDEIQGRVVGRPAPAEEIGAVLGARAPGAIGGDAAEGKGPRRHSG